MRLIVLGFLTLLMAACTPKAGIETGPGEQNLQPPRPEADKSMEEARAESLARIDRKACEAKGGVVRQEGLMGFWRCTLRYRDAGKACRDSDDCEGRCIAKDGPNGSQPPNAVLGACEEDDSPFGCYGLVEDGAVEGFICVD